MNIAENLKFIKAEIPSGVKLIAVSKTKPVDAILEAYNAGQRLFGENKVQEMFEKQALLPKDIQWHLIGHLQTNKVKFIIPFVSLIHGVDSLKLLKEINKQGLNNNRIIDCLLQIHIAQEETKFGLSIEEAEQIFDKELFQLKNVNIVGLMGMASNTDDKEQIKNEFQNLKLFFEKLKATYSTLTTLSMGMSSDYKIAIEQGSTMVRVGSAIFGERIAAVS